MGIEKFATFIGNNYRECRQYKLPPNIASLFIDCNGIFHKAKAKVYLLETNRDFKLIHTNEERKALKANKSPHELEKAHIQEVIKEFEKVLKTFSPSDNLILAPDGCANSAKMQQQKYRRYTKETDPHQIFDGAAISPGTEFMFHLDSAITSWITKTKEIPANTIYSSHMDPGEGEHKIFHYLREGKVVNPEANHVMYGADGDLFLLSLLSPLNHIYLVKEDLKKTYNIDKLKKLIHQKLDFGKTDRKIILQDFVLLTFFIGNDFLPKMPNMADSNDSMIMLQDLYRKEAKYLTNDKNEIIWKNLLKFMKSWRDYKNEYGYDIYVERAVSSSPSFPYPELLKSLMTYDRKGKVLDNPEIGTLRDYQHEFDLETFSRLWYNKQFKPRTKELDEMFPNKEFYGKKDIVNMANYFLKTFQWVMIYYTQGYLKVSNMHFYPYFYGPLFDSVINYLDYLLKKKKTDKLMNVYRDDTQFSVIHQLLLVLSPRSIDLIPSEFRDLYREKLASISPLNFQTAERPEGTSEDSKVVKYIPPINPFLVLMLMEGKELSKKYQAKKAMFIRGERKIRKIEYDIKDINLI